MPSKDLEARGEKLAPIESVDGLFDKLIGPLELLGVGRKSLGRSQARANKLVRELTRPEASKFDRSFYVALN